MQFFSSRRTWFCLKLWILKLTNLSFLLVSFLFLFFVSVPGQIYLWWRQEVPREQRLTEDRLYRQTEGDFIKGNSNSFMMSVCASGLRKVSWSFPGPQTQPHEETLATMMELPLIKKSRYALTIHGHGPAQNAAEALPLWDGQSSEENRLKEACKLPDKSCLDKHIGKRQALPFKGSGEPGGCGHGLWRQMPGFHVCCCYLSPASVLYVTWIILVPISQGFGEC